MARILIAEPSDEVRMLFEHVVARLGHQPLLAAVSPEDVDVGLIEPASKGGLELARSLRSEHPGLPLVFASIYPQTPHTRELDPVAHLLKPFSLSELEAALRAAICAIPRPSNA